jgi:hypothetical protein
MPGIQLERPDKPAVTGVRLGGISARDTCFIPDGEVCSIAYLELIANTQCNFGLAWETQSGSCIFSTFRSLVVNLEEWLDLDS